MGFMKSLLKGDADHAHGELAKGIGSGMPKSHAMAGAIVVTSQDKKTVLLRETASFHGGEYHVEMDLMSKLFPFSKSPSGGGGAWLLPANCRVYLYVYNSPCTTCTTKLAITLRNAWRQGGKNAGVTWKLGFTKFYLKPMPDGHDSVQAAIGAYNTRLAAPTVGWRWKQIIDQ
jgi:hypothetical protein